MAVHEVLTVDELLGVLRECAGDSPVDGDVLDVEFETLGYDSLALMETAAQLNDKFGIVLDDEAVTSARTPRALLEIINGG